MPFIRKHIRFLFVLVLPVYIYIAESSIVNRHTHIYSNGIVVTHSHPWDKEGDVPINQHKHTKTEICLFQSLNFDFYETPPLVFVDFSFPEIHQHLLLVNDQTEYFSPHLKIIPRGPPVKLT